jgi:ketosteroid isomerase-like protein
MSTEENKVVVRRCFEEIDRQNLDVLDDVCTPSYVAHFPGTPGPLPRAGVKPVWAQFFVAFPRLRHIIEDLFSQDDTVVLRLRIEGVHEGELMGMPPTGRSISIGSINFIRCESGKIAEQWIDYDALGMLQQLGAIPSPEQAQA